MTWIVADGHKWSGHMFRTTGRGCSWSSEAFGAIVHLYGATSDEDLAQIGEFTQCIVDAVAKAQPQAKYTIFQTTQEGQTAVAIRATVLADDLAVFVNGKIHRQAIGSLRSTIRSASDRWVR